jgi:hypothetical protein
VETTINRYQHPGEAFQRTALDAFDTLITAGIAAESG